MTTQLTPLLQAQKSLAEHVATFELITDAGKSINDVITGTIPPTQKQYLGAVLFTGMLANCITLLKMLPRPDLPKQLYDLPMCAVATRLIAETYLSFRYLSMEPATDDEFAFRHSLGQFHANYKRHQIAVLFGLEQTKISPLADALDEATRKLTDDPCFRALPPKQRQRLLDKGDERHRSNGEIAMGAGLYGDAWKTIYTYFSQFAHATPMAMYKMREFNAESESAVGDMRLLVQIASGFVSKFILDMEILFPDCGKNISREQRKWLRVDAGVLKQFGRPDKDLYAATESQ